MKEALNLILKLFWESQCAEAIVTLYRQQAITFLLLCWQEPVALLPLLLQWKVVVLTSSQNLHQTDRCERSAAHVRAPSWLLPMPSSLPNDMTSLRSIELAM
jgi:hypothetical protein